MPVVLRVGPYRFYFFSNENQDTAEAPHVHVDSGNGYAEFWLLPVRLRYVAGYNRPEVRRIERILVEHEQLIVGKWHEFLGRR